MKHKNFIILLGSSNSCL